MDWAKDIPCRNIIIYGYCKKEKDGCPFKHDNEKVKKPATLSATTVSTITGTNNSVAQSTVAIKVPSVLSSTPKFNAKVSASFTPMSSKSNIINDDESNLNEVTGNSTLFNKPFSDRGTSAQFPAPSSGALFGGPTFNPYVTESFTPASSSGNHLNLTAVSNGSTSELQHLYPESTDDASKRLVGSGGASDYIADPPISRSPPINFKFPDIYPPSHSLLQYHLYAPDPPPHLKLSLKPNERTPESLFIPNKLREELVKKNLASLQVFPSGGAIPAVVQDYFNLVPLDFNRKTDEKNSNLGHENSLYKVFSNSDGNVYLLRRIHNVKVQDSSLISRTFQNWKHVESANVVKLVDLFQTTKFSDSSLCAVYDYYPLSSSLYEAHFINFPLTPLTQDYLWSYLVQLTNALQAVHCKGLAFDTINWHKVIITGAPGRIKVTGSGPFEVLNFNNNKPNDIRINQQKNFSDLGTLLKDLSSKMSPGKSPTIEEMAIDDSLKTVLNYLLDDQNMEKNIKQLTSLFYDKILGTLDSSISMIDHTEGVLSKELENGRLFRLMCKLNFIYGRMESRIDIDWSESGANFPIVLFYDYVFHQVDASGKNTIDLTHVLRCLNKLDAGVLEKIVLATPDEMNCIIISYKELRDLIDSTFRSIMGQ